MNGALPPSSSETFFSCARALRHQELPDLGRAREAELPHRRVRGHLAPISGASSAAPVTTESTPAGNPASSASAATASAESGVCSAGFSTIVQPAASAGADLRVVIAAGKFHGVIPAVTPTGCFEHEDAPIGQRRRDRVAVDALGLLAEPLVERGRVRDLGARLGERLALLGHQQTREIVLVLEHQVGQPPQHTRTLLRGAAAPGGQRAARAASIARRVSAAPIRGTSATTSPVAGFDDRERLARVGVDPAPVDVRPPAEQRQLDGGHRDER